MLLTGHISEASPVGNVLSMFKVGDLVKVDLDIDILKQMQEGHGGWNPRMAEVCGIVWEKEGRKEEIATVDIIIYRIPNSADYSACDEPNSTV